MTSTKIKGYRHKETLPKTFDRAAIITIAKAAGEGKKHGMPSVGLEQLANKILVEGREDAGTNEYNYNNKEAKALYDILIKKGHPDKAAMYVAAVLDKQQVANRLKIPFEMAWNGVGKSKSTGRTGRQHADRAKSHETAQTDPRNKELVDLIKRSAEGENTAEENLLSMPYEKVYKAVLGLPEDSNVFYTGGEISGDVVSAVNKKVATVIDEMYKSEDGKRAARAVRTPDLYDIALNVDHLYKHYSGIENASETNQGFKELAENPIVQAAFGVDPGAAKYIEKYREDNPVPPDIFDKLMSFLRGDKE